MVGSGKQSDEIWSFAKLDSFWPAEKQTVSEERLRFMELGIYFIYVIVKPNPLVVQSKG